MTKFNEFYNQSDLYHVFGRSYALKNENSYIKSKIQQNNFALAIDEKDLDNDKNLVHLSDINEYAQGFDNSSFYDYYKKLYPFNKNEKRKIKEKIKSIEGMRQIL